MCIQGVLHRINCSQLLILFCFDIFDDCYAKGLLDSVTSKKDEAMFASAFTGSCYTMD